MPNQFSQLLCMDTIRNANNHLEPGERTMLACDNSISQSTVKAALTILKDHDYAFWIELHEHNLAEKIIGVYSDPIKRHILLLIDQPIAKDEMLKDAVHHNLQRIASSMNYCRMVLFCQLDTLKLQIVFDYTTK